MQSALDFSVAMIQRMAHHNGSAKLVPNFHGYRDGQPVCVFMTLFNDSTTNQLELAATGYGLDTLVLGALSKSEGVAGIEGTLTIIGCARDKEWSLSELPFAITDGQLRFDTLTCPQPDTLTEPNRFARDAMLHALIQPPVPVATNAFGLQTGREALDVTTTARLSESGALVRLHAVKDSPRHAALLLAGMDPRSLLLT